MEHAESIADHMYRMAIITMMCPDPTVKKDRCVKMAIIHDMAEALVGDITPLDKVPKGLYSQTRFAHNTSWSPSLPYCIVFHRRIRGPVELTIISHM